MTTLPGDASALHDDFGDIGAPDPGTPAAKAIEGRSLTQIAWSRMKKDRVAMAAGAVVILLVLMAVFAPLLANLFGVGDPQKQYTDLIDPDYSTPIGGMGGMSASHLLGLEPQLGRDLFSRVLFGSRISLLIATLASLLSLVIGVTMGVVAGYFGGKVDAAISRLMDIFLAFPLLLFALALAAIVSDRFSAFGVTLTGDPLHISVLVFIIGFFGWPYAGRIVRGQTISLRQREFVDAARVLGARPSRIIVKELMPNLIAPILVYATLLIPANILFEAALSFLGVGIHPPTPSWGAMMNDAINWYKVDPEYLIVPGCAIFVTVLAFNLFGDGLRDAFDPKSH